MVRTSQTDPLEISEIACGEGLIGLTFCPGKTGPSVFGAPWARDLEIDISVIKVWGADYVLSLIEDHEFDLLQVRRLGDAVRAAGMTWIHAPIVDLGAPSVDFERRWTVVGHVLRTCLRSGGRVLVHCRGGRGRAGLVAARLMVELGQDAQFAIEQVRDVRPGAIETQGQEAFVRQVKPVTTDEQDGRLLGCLFGGAVGDGFGYAIEFDRLATIRAKHGPTGLTEPLLTNGQLVVSDDTQMTLFTAEALGEVTRPDLFIDACRAAYLRWYGTQRGRLPKTTGKGKGLLSHASLWARRAPGNTCMSALAAGGTGTIERPINDSKGCGGVMRTAPIGLLYPADVAFDLGARASALTHGHPSGYLSGGAMAAIVSGLAGGMRLTDAVVEAIHILRGRGGADETIAALEGAIALAGKPGCDGQDVARGSLGEGWVGEEALAIAVYACLVSDEFEDAIRIAANHDGDSDSTASVAGQLLGAARGVMPIRWDWIERLDVFDAVADVAGRAPALHGHFATRSETMGRQA